MHDRQIEKLRQQVRRYEEKGMYNTAAHQMLARLEETQKSNDVVNRRNAVKAKQEADNGQ